MCPRALKRLHRQSVVLKSFCRTPANKSPGGDGLETTVIFFAVLSLAFAHPILPHGLHRGFLASSAVYAHLPTMRAVILISSPTG